MPLFFTLLCITLTDPRHSEDKMASLCFDLKINVQQIRLRALLMAVGPSSARKLREGLIAISSPLLSTVVENGWAKSRQIVIVCA